MNVHNVQRHGVWHSVLHINIFEYAHSPSTNNKNLTEIGPVDVGIIDLRDSVKNKPRKKETAAKYIGNESLPKIIIK